MNEEEFMENIADIMQTEEALDYTTVLENLEEWDSISKMALIAFLEKFFKISLKISDLSEFNTIGDIAKKAGIK